MMKWLRRALTLTGRIIGSFFDPLTWSISAKFNQLNDADQVYLLNLARLLNRWDEEHPDQTKTVDEEKLIEAEAQRLADLEVQAMNQTQTHLGLLHVDAYNCEAINALLDWDAAHPDQDLPDRQVNQLEVGARRRAKWWVWRQRFSAWLRGRDVQTIQRRSQTDWDDLYDDLPPGDVADLLQQAREFVEAAHDRGEGTTLQRIDLRLELAVLRGQERWQAAHPDQPLTLPDRVAIRAEAQQQIPHPGREE